MKSTPPRHLCLVLAASIVTLIPLATTAPAGAAGKAAPQLPPGCLPEAIASLRGTCAPTPFCGDRSCNGGESAATCPTDCPAVCGDGVCTHSESTSTCFADCRPPVGSVTDGLKITTYNTKLVAGDTWPSDNCEGSDCDETRGKYIGHRLMGRNWGDHVFDWADVVMLQETFDNSARGRIREQINKDANGQPVTVYRGTYWGQPKGPSLNDDGGLSGLSKLPWTYDGSMEEQFTDCDGNRDCWQSKGFKAVRIALPVSGGAVYVINTHLTPDDGYQSNTIIRRNQLEQIRNWIDRTVPNEPVILVGDLNLQANTNEYLYDKCGPDGSGRCTLGPLAGFVDVYRKVWGEPTAGYRETGYTKYGTDNSQGGSSNKRIDYIFYRETAAVGIKPRSQWDTFVDRQPVGDEYIDQDRVRCEYLSDHFALSAALDFCYGPCANPGILMYKTVIGDGRCNGFESECNQTTVTAECGRNSRYSAGVPYDNHCPVWPSP